MKQNIREYTLRDVAYTFHNGKHKSVMVIGVCYNSQKDPFDITYTVTDGAEEFKTTEDKLFKTKEELLNQ